MNTSSQPGADELLAAITPVDADARRRLHERLVADAEAHGLLDIAYRNVDTPVGNLMLAATTHGLVRVAYDREDHESVLQALAASVSPRILHAPGRLDHVARELEEYFAGRRTTFDVALDFRLTSGFRLGVLAHLPQIGYGRTQSYAEVAAATGRPKAVRAVGTACATNPLPIVVPCHRVVRSDGAVGGYLGGPEAKQALLTLEASAA